MTSTSNPFITLLESLGSGALFDMSAQVQEAVERAQDTGKMSSISLTLKFKPQGSGRVEIVDEIKQSLPAFPRQTTLMYAEGGVLTVDDPKQHKLELKSVDTAPTKFKEVK